MAFRAPRIVFWGGLREGGPLPRVRAIVVGLFWAVFGDL